MNFSYREDNKSWSQKCKWNELGLILGNRVYGRKQSKQEKENQIY